MIDVLKVNRRSEGIALIDLLNVSEFHAGVLFAKSRVRKLHRCADCKGKLMVGDYAFRPVGNQSFRSARVCERCVAVRGGRNG